MVPFLEQVVVDPDREQHVLTLAVFSLQSPLNFAQHRAALKGVLGADDDDPVVGRDADIDLTPDRLSPCSVFSETPHAQMIRPQLVIDLIAKTLIDDAVADEAGMELARIIHRSNERFKVRYEGIREASSLQELLREVAPGFYERINSDH